MAKGIKDTYPFRILRANLILIILFAAVVLFASPTLVRILLLALCIFLTGRAVLDFLVPVDLFESGSLNRAGSDFQAIAVGPAVLLLITGLLKAAGLYSFYSAVAVMLGIIVFSLFFNRRFSRYLALRPNPLNAYTCMYVATGIFFILYYYPYGHPLLNESALYTTTGFDLFMDKSPSQIPAMGEMIPCPLAFMTHTIESVFALFSYGDHFAYYTLGQFWVHVLLTPLIPLGAYLFFRRSLPWHLSALAAVLFCSSVLGIKIWSLRGESLAWILGFPFLFTLRDLLQDIGKDGITRRSIGSCILLSLIYLGLATAHGVAAAIVTFLSFGFIAYLVVSRVDLRLYKRIAAIGLLFVVSFGSFSFVYIRSFSYSEGPKENVFSADRNRPAAGEEDAAVVYEIESHKITGSPWRLDKIPIVKDAPPFLDPVQVAGAAAFIPAASMFYHGNLMSLPVLEYPANLLRSLSRVRFFERIIYCALLLYCCYLMIKLGKSLATERQSMFWASVAVYLALIAFSVYMDFRSVSVFPLRSTVRTMRYGRFFYWFAVAVTFCTVDSRALLGPLRSGYLSNNGVARFLSSVCSKISTFASKFIPRQAAEFAILSLVFLLWLQSSCIGEDNFLVKVHLLRPEARRDSIALAINEVFSAATMKTGQYGSGRESLFDAVKFIENNTSVGDWVFVNCLGESHFWYLSSGRCSLVEGPALMHINSLMKMYSPRLASLRKFALTADLRYVSDFSFRYVLLFKFCTDPDRILYSGIIRTNLGAFEKNSDFKLAYENDNFAVFRRVDDGGIESKAGPAIADEEMKPDCLSAD
jgi:hypothetical protein